MVASIPTNDFEANGEWSEVAPLTIIPLHAIVLPDGKVLSFGSTELGMQGGQFVFSLYDPETGVEKVLPNTTGTNVFCSHMALDPVTGNVVIMGGDGSVVGTGNLSGIPDVLVFDYRTEEIRNAAEGDLEFGRYYGTVVTLASGEIMMIGGRDEYYNGSIYPEVFTSGEGIRTLTDAAIQDMRFNDPGTLADGTYWYPHAWVNSRGEVIVIEGEGDDIYRMNTDGTGSVQKIGQIPFAEYTLNPSVMFDKDMIAITSNDGGLWVANIADNVPTFTKVAQLNNAHTSGSLVPLPDGTVAILGGSRAFDQGNDLNNANYAVTIWDPADNSLTVMDDGQSLARLYHSSFLLLEDGSIWAGGGGSPGPLTNTNVEFFAPDYLYGPEGSLADRPKIIDAPTNIDASQTFVITLDDARSIEKISALKSGASTHAGNHDSRYIPLEFAVLDDTRIEVTTPDANVMIPGLWMLFAVDDAGVPSKASMLGIDMDAPVVDTAPLQQDDLTYFNIDDDQINGAFEATVEARFDDLSSGNWQRVFDFGNGPNQDNVWLGQVAGTDDMRFAVVVNGFASEITAPNAIIEGEIADWRVSVDGTGYMQLSKNDVLVAEGQGQVPTDVDRVQNYVGDSNWLGDARLQGLVRNLEIVNEGDTPETDGQNPTMPMPDPTPAFEAVATATFEDVTGGQWQRVFDLGNGPDSDNIWLGQVFGTNEMRFEVLDGATKYAVTAANIIIEGETATWTARINSDGVMTLLKNGTAVATGQGIVPNDVVREALVGESHWVSDTALIGSVSSAVIDYYGDGVVDEELSYGTAPQPQPEPDPNAITFGDSTYVLGTAGLTWEQASAEALSLGGRIVEINSAAENKFIFDTFGGDSAPIWLDLIDTAAEGTFVNSNGQAAAYTNWLPGEPNNDGNQDYATMASSTGQWDDAGNTGGWHFNNGWSGGYQNQLVIEFEAEAPTPEPGVDGPVYVIAGQSNVVRVGDRNNLEASFEALGIEGTIVKSYEGGTALAPAWNNDWYPFEDFNPATGELFGRLLADMDAALANSETAELKGFLWVQGETDAYIAGAPDQYAARMEQFITVLQDRYGPDFNFTIVQLSENMPARQEVAANWAQVMRAQSDVAAQFENVTLLDPDDLIAAAGFQFGDVLEDYINYGDTATQLIADAFAQQFVDSPDPDPQPEPDPNAITFGDSTYVLGTAGLTWEQANAEAQALGGEIVEINSAAEDAFIFETFGGDSAPIWLNLTDTGLEGVFVNTNGEAAAYTNWLPGEPNNDGNQDYATMASSTGQWDDAGNAGGWYYDGAWSGGYENQLVIEFA